MQSAPDSITTDAFVKSSVGVEYGRGWRNKLNIFLKSISYNFLFINEFLGQFIFYTGPTNTKIQ